VPTGRDAGKKNEKDIIHKKLDGELNRHETAIIRKKLKSDPITKVEYQSLKNVTDTARKVAKPAPPPADFKDRVIRDIKPENG
jgi:anti-sigma factor RsiW